jgi:hypothetical protein
MREKTSALYDTEKRSRCESDHFFSGSSCAEPGKVDLEGLVFCEKHALEIKLEEQIACWRGMLFHIDLWSREAARRERADVVQLLEVQRAEAAWAIERACADLDRGRSEIPGEPAEPGENREELTGRFRRVKRARLLSRGHRCH